MPTLHIPGDSVPVAIRWTAFLALLLGPCPALSAQADGARPVLADSAIRRVVLPNGLSIYIRPNGYPAHRAELRLVVDAGSIQEDADQLGIAHVVEHMAFSGTAHFPGDSVWGFFQRIGVPVGADVNATTGFDDTIYQMAIPTDDSTIVRQAITLLGDWIRGLDFDPAKLDRERKVVTEEHRTSLGPQRRAMERRLDLLLAGSRYPARLPIGSPDLIRTVDLETVRRFYRDWYRPERIAVVVVGDVDPDRIERQLRTEFSGITRPAPARGFSPEVVPAASAARALVVADSELTSTIVLVNYREPNRVILTQADLRLQVARILYDQLLNERLRRRALDTMPPFIAAGAGGTSYTRDVYGYQLSAQVRSGQAVQGLAAALDEVARVNNDGFSPAEFSRGRVNLGRDIDQLVASLNRVTSGEIAATIAASHLQREPVADRARQLDDVRVILGDLAEPEVRAAGRARFSDPAPLVMSQGPVSDAPSEPELLAQLTGPRRDLGPYLEPGEALSLLRSEPVAGHVRRSDQVREIGVTRLELSNGVRVVLKPTEFDRSEVLLSGYRPGGFGLASDSMLIAAQTMPPLVCGSGAGDHDPVALTRLLAGRIASLSCSLSETDEGFSGRAAPADLETLLQLVYLQFTAPRLDSQVVTRYHTQVQEALVHRAAEPMNALSDTLTLLLANHSPRARLLDSTFARQVDASRSLAWFRQRYADAAGFTFLLVGSFNPDSVVPLIERYLGSLPAAAHRATVRPVRRPAPRTPASRLLRTGHEPRATTVLVFQHSGPSTPAERVRIAALRHVLSQRLEAVLRRKEGGVYGVSVDAEAVSVPSWAYQVSIQFDAAPERRDELMAQITQTIAALSARGASTEELDSYRTERRRGRETGMVTNGWWLSSIARADQLGWPLAGMTSDRDATALDPSDIAATATRYLGRKNLIEVALLPAR